MVMHVATVEGLVRGRASWAAGQIGESAHPVNGCPQEDPLAAIGRASVEDLAASAGGSLT